MTRCGLLLCFAMLSILGGGRSVEARQRVGEREIHDVANEVAALANRSHARRELAKQRLRVTGSSAIAELRTVLDSPVLETRLAAKGLIAEIEHQQLEQKIYRLLDPHFAEEATDLPGWKSFSQSAGNTPEARSLYAVIVRHHFSTLAWLDSLNSNSGEDDLANETAYLELDRYLPIDVARIDDGDPARWSLLLLAASNPTLINAPILSSRIRGGLLNPGVSERINASQHGVVLKRMIATWLEVSSACYLNSSMLRIALTYRCEQTARELAKRTLADSNQSPAGVATSLILLARLDVGNATDELSRYLDDRRICHVWQMAATRRMAVQTQVRDVAMAISLHLAGHDPRQVGFVVLEADPLTIYREFSMGFEDDESRERAHVQGQLVLDQTLDGGEKKRRKRYQ